jgi:hypothetical protein
LRIHRWLPPLSHTILTLSPVLSKQQHPSNFSALFILEIKIEKIMDASSALCVSTRSGGDGGGEDMSHSRITDISIASAEVRLSDRDNNDLMDK